jgi:hypothetical protein
MMDLVVDCPQVVRDLVCDKTWLFFIQGQAQTFRQVFVTPQPCKAVNRSVHVRYTTLEMRDRSVHHSEVQRLCVPQNSLSFDCPRRYSTSAASTNRTYVVARALIWKLKEMEAMNNTFSQCCGNPFGYSLISGTSIETYIVSSPLFNPDALLSPGTWPSRPRAKCASESNCPLLYSYRLRSIPRSASQVLRDEREVGLASTCHALLSMPDITGHQREPDLSVIRFMPLLALVFFFSDFELNLENTGGLGAGIP